MSLSPHLRWYVPSHLGRTMGTATCNVLVLAILQAVKAGVFYGGQLIKANSGRLSFKHRRRFTSGTRHKKLYDSRKSQLIPAAWRSQNSNFRAFSRLREWLLQVAWSSTSGARPHPPVLRVKVLHPPAYVQPSPATIDAFNSFAPANGRQPNVVSPSGEWVSIALSVSQPNALFAANFEQFTYLNMTAPLTRTLSLSLLRNCRAARSRRSRCAIPPDSCLGPEDTITPACLQTFYRIPLTPATQTSNTLLLFLQTYRPDMPSSTTFVLESLDGGKDAQGPFLFNNVLEASLDVQYTVGLATGVPVTFLSVGNDTTETGFITSLLDTTIFLAGAPDPSSTMTTSQICNGYMALGARGISVLFSSGDDGVRGGHDVPLQCTNDTFIPVFPASCPFVTSVGATVNFAPETAESFSSGGFSDVFPMPAYQSASRARLSQGSPYAVMIQDVTSPSEGTSCSSARTDPPPPAHTTPVFVVIPLPPTPFQIVLLFSVVPGQWAGTIPGVYRRKLTHWSPEPAALPSLPNNAGYALPHIPHAPHVVLHHTVATPLVVNIAGWQVHALQTSDCPIDRELGFRKRKNVPMPARARPRRSRVDTTLPNFHADSWCISTEVSGSIAFLNLRVS
ncbi:hypothetical protein C8J57DRAFT_1523315 [Mycena rebaudengoi]|nr:hypothetical protein C8J57DRAFT_1523315 [Mycena rebaudengoi]